MKKDKSNKVFRYENDKLNKNKQKLYDNEYSEEFNDENRQLELEIEERKCFTKTNNKKSNKKRGFCVFFPKNVKNI